MNSMNFFSFSPCIRLSAGMLLAFCSVAADASQTSEFETASKEATSNYSTKVGRQYSNEFQDAIAPAMAKAMGSCLSRPDTVQPAEIVFIVSADGHVKRVLCSPNIEYGRCVASTIRLPATVPKPPRDLWPVVIGLANHSHAEKASGPPDTPVALSTKDQLATYDKAIAPYVAKARATYPAAKQRFLAGLPPGHRFSVRIRLVDRDGKVEDAFIKVETIKGANITGVISSHLNLVTDYKTGQRMTFPESKIDNWLILRPDGTEEGNAVGKSLDTYKPR
jgi:uncharacterized protein YegJ (DUF2314 family)